MLPLYGARISCSKILVNLLWLSRHDSIKKNVERTFNVWKERNVYDNEFVEKLIELLNTSTMNSSVTITATKNDKNNNVNSPDSGTKQAKEQDEVDSKSSNKSPTNEIEIQRLIAEFQVTKQGADR